jgi:hypothetical protein
MNALKLIEFFNYDYKLTGLALLLVEQRKGREIVDRLLAEIPAPSVQKNARYFVNTLRELCSVEEKAGQDQESLPEPHKLPGEKKYGKPVLKEN